MAPNDLISLAKAAAATHGLNPALVCAVCEWESEGWNTWAVRFEPAFDAKYLKPMVPHLPATEEMTRAMSFGLMQVMGQVARERGFTGKFLSQLCNPATGLDVGCKQLKACVDKHPDDVRAALLAWNGGGNPGYPDSVVPLMEKYR